MGRSASTQMGRSASTRIHLGGGSHARTQRRAPAALTTGVAPMSRRRRTLRVAAAAVLAGSLALPVTQSLAASGSPTPVAKSSTFTVGITQDIDSLNPFVGILASSYETYQLAYDTLTNYAPGDFAAQPGLASKWTTSSDGLTWT